MSRNTVTKTTTHIRESARTRSINPPLSLLRALVASAEGLPDDVTVLIGREGSGDMSATHSHVLSLSYDHPPAPPLDLPTRGVDPSEIAPPERHFVIGANRTTVREFGKHLRKVIGDSPIWVPVTNGDDLRGWSFARSHVHYLDGWDATDTAHHATDRVDRLREAIQFVIATGGDPDLVVKWHLVDGIDWTPTE